MNDNLQIAIMNKHEAEKYALERHSINSIVISISSCKCNDAFIVPNNASGIMDVLKLSFNDTDSKEFLDGGILDEDANKIVEFIDKYKDNDELDLIIIHCEAGQSRSAGVAAAIMKYLFNDDTEIFNNNKFTPNMLCYRKVLNAFMEKEYNNE